MALLLAYGAARLSERVFTEMRQIVFARVMARSSRMVMLSVFRHLHSLSLRFHLNRRTGGVTRDVERGGSAISDLLDWTLYTIVPTLIEVILVTGVLVFLYDITFALVTSVVLVAYIAWTVVVTEWRTKFYRASVEADTKASASAVDSLLNYETVKYFNNEAHEATRYDASLRQMEEANVKSLQDPGGAQRRPERDRRDRRDRADVEGGRRRHRRQAQRRRPGAGQCLPAADGDAAELPRHDVSRGQAGADQYRTPVGPAR